jgi:Holliday junction resolvase RusA-like endonuclease
MSWEELYRIRVFGDPVETPRHRHTIMPTAQFAEWRECDDPAALGTKEVLKLLWVHTYVPSKADAWKRTVRYHVLPFMAKASPIESPVRVDIEFIMPRPKGHYGTGRNAGKIKASSPYLHSGIPDKDNLEKAVLDALSATPTVTRRKLPPKHANDPVYNFPGIWRNDGQVCSGLVEKRYHRDLEEPGAMIVVSRWVEQTELIGCFGASN